MNPHGQLIIDVWNNATPTARSSPHSIEHRCLAYHYTAYIYIYTRDINPPSQSITEALHTATPTVRCNTMHIYIAGR